MEKLEGAFPIFQELAIREVTLLIRQNWDSRDERVRVAQIIIEENQRIYDGQSPLFYCEYDWNSAKNFMHEKKWKNTWDHSYQSYRTKICENFEPEGFLYGIIKKVHIKPGQILKKGDKICDIELHYKL